MTLTAGFYADDVTGATDALLQYERTGLRGRLRFDGDVGDPDGVDVIGVAGGARALPTARIEDEVRPVLDAFGRLTPRVIQYKVCSTFDSSPAIGSIGRACEVAIDAFGERTIPVLAAQPELGRYTVFSHHYARAGDGRVHRLDRHPTMSRHPVTPMRQSSLVEVLRGQTDRVPVRAVDIVELRGRAEPRWNGEPSAVVFDGLDDADVDRVGELVWRHAGDEPSFVVGAGGLSAGLARAVSNGGPGASARNVRSRTGGGASAPAVLPAVPNVLAVSGSRAPQTAVQLDRARAAGWETAAAGDADLDRVVAVLAAGRSMVVYSAIDAPPPHDLDALLARVLAAALETTRVRRLLIVGGDTAGRVLRHLSAEAAELAGVAAGLPVCRMLSRRPELDGVEVVLKGGQVGGPDVFEEVRCP
jgi:uncharacterized protein YgbK (DUF1537 family)